MPTFDPETVCAAPPAVSDLAEQAVVYVQRALNVAPDFTAETLPLVDHYLGMVPQQQAHTVELVASTQGAYFGEVLRRLFGGTWQMTGETPASWRFELPGGVSLSPFALCKSAILRADPHATEDPGIDRAEGAPARGPALPGRDASVDEDPGDFVVPLPVRAAVSDALAQKAPVTADEFYSLSGRLETLAFILDCVAALSTRPSPHKRK